MLTIRQPTMLSLFSGIGGIDLAAAWAGIQTVAFCEIDPFCQKVLQKHWPGVPIYSDIKQLRGEDIGPVDIIAGGFPCQPFSIAGKKQGKDDDRHLWPEMFRIIRELRPNWVVGENVANFARMALDDALADMESIGYSSISFIIPACAVSAPHERKRTVVVCYSSNQPGLQTHSKVIPFRSQQKSRESAVRFDRGEPFGVYWDAHQPPFPGVANGFPNRMDRSKPPGNAVVPQQLYPVFKAITTGIKYCFFEPIL